MFPPGWGVALWPGQLTPRLQESQVRLGTWLPFAQAAEALAFLTGMTVLDATMRRTTAAVGVAYGAVQTATMEAIERQLPHVPPGSRVQLLSVDGAMVPLQRQEQAEVKPIAIGTVSVCMQERGEWVVHTEELSYVSRLTDAEIFGRSALVETQQRRDRDGEHGVCRQLWGRVGAVHGAEAPRAADSFLGRRPLPGLVQDAQPPTRVTKRPETVTTRALGGGCGRRWWSAARLSCAVAREAVQAP